MIINKYLAGLLAVLGTVAFGFQQASADNIVDANEAWNLAALFVGALAAIWVPLLKGGWAAGLKVGAAVVLAVIGTIVGALVTGVFDLNTWTAIVFAGINALLVQLGVSIRVDQTKAAIADPKVSNSAVIGADEPAVKAVAPTAVG
jgi:peptidoglycan/LPS O-acetylase OafA/YrhL